MISLSCVFSRYQCLQTSILCCILVNMTCYRLLSLSRAILLCHTNKHCSEMMVTLCNNTSDTISDGRYKTLTRSLPSAYWTVSRVSSETNAAEPCHSQSRRGCAPVRAPARCTAHHGRASAQARERRWPGVQVFHRDLADDVRLRRGPGPHARDREPRRGHRAQPDHRAGECFPRA